MKTRMILTSVCAMVCAMPAFARTASDEFPNASNQEYMQADYRYINAANATNMAGVYADDDTVYAEAIWEALPVCNINDYTAEQLAEMGLAHAASLSGTTGACVVETCEDGYHACDNNLSCVIDRGSALHSVYKSRQGNQPTAANNYEDYDLQNPGDFAVEYKDGIVYGTSVCSSTEGADLVEGDVAETVTNDTTEGRYCWCKLNGWAPAGEERMELSSQWVFHRQMGVEGCPGSCSNSCASYMKGIYAISFRNAMFDAVTTPLPGPARICVGNHINIQWYYNDTTVLPVNGGSMESCKYGGDIYTPQDVAPREGYIFKGWKFRNTPVSE